MDAKTIAPWARNFDEVGPIGIPELRAIESRRDRLQACTQLRKVGHDEPDGAMNTLRLTRGHVNLAASDIDPHVVHADHEVGIACEAHAHNVEDSGEPLIRLA